MIPCGHQNRKAGALQALSGPQKRQVRTSDPQGCACLKTDLRMWMHICSSGLCRLAVFQEEVCVDSRYFKRRAFNKTNTGSLWGLAFGSPPLVIHYRYRPECNLLQKRMLLRVHPPYPCSSDYSHFVFKPPSVSLHGLSIQRSLPPRRRHRRSAAPD